MLLWPYGRDVQGGMTTYPMLFPIGSVWQPDADYEKSVPRAILEDLKQASACEEVGAIYGAALLYRRAVQYLCRDKKAPDKGLKAQITELASRGTITDSLKSLADHIRIVANDVAHPDARHPARIEWKDVKAAREFARQLVDAVYVSPHKAAALRKGLKKKRVPEA